MNNEKIVISSKTIELAEHKTYIELTNRLCYYDVPNRNGVMLPFASAEEKAQTLIDQPVVAKYRKDALGRPDLGGHEMYKDPITNEVKFGTENIGTHVSVEIKEDEVEISGVKRTLWVLIAKSKVWTRNKNVVAAIKRLFAEGKLHSSWEIIPFEFTFNNGIKTITDYVFETNALLGSMSEPAYWGAGTLEIAENQNCELLIASALANDINITLQEQEENNLAKVNKKELEISQKNETLIKANEKIVELKTEVSNLTPFKESCENAERERIEAEVAQKKTNLSAKMTKSKLFTAEELESSEIRALVDSANESAIKNLMADKLMASLALEDADSNGSANVEVSTTNNTPKANIDADYSEMSFSELMNAYSNKK